MSAEINKPGNKGLTHLIHSTVYSIQGLKAAVTHEEAFRLELMALVVMLPLAVWLGEGAIEHALLIGCLFLVLIVELINSAVEAVVDRVGVEHHELSGRAKDIGSAAVFIALMNVVMIWGVILYEKFF